MGRSRAFDEAAVLAGAMMAFREHGYAGASVKHLETATGLSAGSLYNAFGDKAGLYRAALEFYFAQVIDLRLVAARTLEDLEAAFLALFEAPMTDGFGCMVINGVIEFGGQGEGPAADLLTRGLDTIDQSLARVFAAELGPAAEVAARRLALTYQGLLVLARSGRPMAPFVPAIEDEFAQLRALRANHKT